MSIVYVHMYELGLQVLEQDSVDSNPALASSLCDLGKIT